MLHGNRWSETSDMRTSLIVLTYNWPQALGLVLQSITKQSRLPDEVVIADDGSTAATRELIETCAATFPCRLSHVWQDDLGFRAARARNRAIASSRGDYMILLDGDMLLHPSFVADHLALVRQNSFLQGGRLRASEQETTQLLAGKRPRFDWLLDGQFDTKHEFKRRHAFRAMWLARRAARRGGNVMSCNMSFWRTDLDRVNGFDERMQGYGSEDIELAARLHNAGVRQRQLKYAGLAVHLHHATRAPPDPHDLSMPNNRLLQATREHHLMRCALGLDQYREEFEQAPSDLRKKSDVADWQR